MKIGFDAKRAMKNFTGLGNYSRFVIKNLVHYFPENTYELFSPNINPENEETKFRSDVIIFLKKGFKPLWRTLGIAKNIKEEGIDLYHGLSGELPYRINKTGAKSIVTVHDLIFLRHPEVYTKIDRTIYNIKARYACRVADRIVAISECTKKDIVHYYNTDPQKIDVIYQGCFDIFGEEVNENRKQEVREKHKLPSRYILSVGSIEERKNILLAVKALSDVPEDIHLVVIGKRTKYAEQVVKYADDNGLSNRIQLLSGIPLSDLPAIFQSAELFVYPSVYEGFGIPIIEALNSKIPIIAAIGSCLEEAGGPDSIYIDPKDNKELAKQINRVLNDADLRERMVSKGLEFVRKFDKEACSRNLMEVYNKIMP